ncbi:MAG: tail fiber domain-containing protein, partial [Bacteroidota bacterium]
TPEMSPRARLTIAPYALSLKGNSNLLPSTGTVGGGTVTPNSNYLLHLNNASGAADERLEGTTGAQMTFKKGSAQYFLGLTSSDNKFRLNSGTSDMKFRYSGSDILTVLSGGISVTGSGIFSAGLTSSGGASTLNNIKLESSAISNTAATKFKHSGNAKLEINTDGVGVTGLLDLTGSKSYNTAYAFYANDGNLACASTGTASGSNNYSLSTTGTIRATEFNATSDRRIKKDIVPADNAADQEILRRLRVCDYKYIDFANYGTSSKKGFIAQEVREVFPEAVTASRDFIPDVFDRPSEYVVRDGRILLSMPDAHGLAEGDLVRLYSPDGQQDLSVMSVQDSHSFILADWKGGRPEWVFVFGKQVDDFLQVDYDRIHTLNVSATRELVRQLETAEADARAVREEIGNNKSKIDQLELRMRYMEARISN